MGVPLSGVPLSGVLLSGVLLWEVLLWEVLLLGVLLSGVQVSVPLSGVQALVHPSGVPDDFIGNSALKRLIIMKSHIFTFFGTCSLQSRLPLISFKSIIQKKIYL